MIPSLVSEHKASIAGVVLISGLYDLPQFLAEAKSDEAKAIVNSLSAETDGTEASIQERSVLSLVNNLKASVLIMNGAKDDRTIPDQARQLANAIIENGGKACAIIYPDYGHQIPVSVRDREIDPFIDAVLK